MTKPIEVYIRQLQQNLQASNATEHTHRPALQAFVQALHDGVQAINEPKHRTDCGAPDFVVLQSRGHLPIGHMEAKDIGVSLADTHKGEQLKRYRKYLPNLILTDYVSFRWYVNGDLWADASLGAIDIAAGRIRPSAAQQEAVVKLLADFLNQTPQPINNAKALAQRLARLTHMIRDIVVAAFAQRQASSILRDLRQVLTDSLIPDLTKDENTAQFADLYAQTLTYGLFAARCHQNQFGGTFNLHEAAGEIPRTNPLLRHLFDAITGPDFDDEPYAGFVQEIIAVLGNAAISEILEDFGHAAVRQDPILHFYETFLATYDPELRERRGVYYTPEPVVSYIVRSVDHLLKTRFKIKDGLADTETISYLPPDAHGHPDVAPPKAHRTLILDPAAGTGTFLYEVIETIREHFRNQRRAGFWNEYVHDHLLPRLFGFELLMAPYAMAHLKLGMQLAAQDLPEDRRSMWTYGFETDDRLQIYLTNTLEQVERHTQQALGSLQRAISKEAAQAAKVKRDLPILVVLGNPPYSGISSNQSDWIDGLLKGALPDGQGGTIPTASYYHVDGKPLGERNPKWLQDDYVKFIRWAQWRLEQTGQGVLAFITNHSYLDSPTFRGMRWALMQAFDDIYILDLHGSAKRREVAPNGKSDENVFDIMQGVAIGIFVKRANKKSKGKSATVCHADLWGTREEKYEWLNEQSAAHTEWEQVEPVEPFYLFKPFDRSEVGDYYGWPAINNIMPINSVGIVTSRDSFVIDFDRSSLFCRIQDFATGTESDDVVRSRYLRNKDKLDVHAARNELKSDPEIATWIHPVLYRPFDQRHICYHDAIIERSRRELMPHMLTGDNAGLVICRQCIGATWDHVFATRQLTDDSMVSNRTRERGYICPIYIYPGVGKTKQQMFDQWPAGKDGRRPNLDPNFVMTLEQATGFTFVSDGRGDLDSSFGPEDVLAYIYAVFHWPEYRRRYEPMLKLDFPRVPPPSEGGQERFVNFARLGHELLATHLLEDEGLAGSSISYPMHGDNVVAKGYPKYVPPGAKPVKAGKAKLLADARHGRVYINPEQFFEGVEPAVWAFQIGGYQVCDKWLKDRRDRTLSYDDLTHYTRVVEALRKTIDVMGRIEAAAVVAEVDDSVAGR